MTLLAGYDFVTEIANETLLQLIKANTKIGGVPLSPPFDATIPFSNTALGDAWLLVKDLKLDLNANDTITLIIAFEKSTVTMTGPIITAFGPMSGDVGLTAPIGFQAKGQNKQVPVCSMESASVSINFSPETIGMIEAQLANLPITLDQFLSMFEQSAASYFQSMGQIEFPLEFAVVQGKDGSLKPLQFERLDLKNIHNVDRAKQALAIMGSFFTADHTSGNPALKTQTALTGSNEICVSASPLAFHRLVFAPSVAEAMNVPIASLPPTCGTAKSVGIQGVTLTSISDTFANGLIHVNGAMQKSGFCYDAHGSFHGTIVLSISGSILTPTLSMDEPNVRVDVPWYCYLAAGALFGSIGLVATGIVDSVADGIVENMANAALQNAFGSSVNSITLGGLGGVSFDEVSVTTEGINLQGYPPYIDVPSGMYELLGITGSVVNNNKTQISSGQVHIKWAFTNVEKDYPYIEYKVDQTGVYTIQQKLIPPPFQIEWELRVQRAGNTYSDIYPLLGESGTVTLSNIECDYPTPLLGGMSVDQDVTVSFVRTTNGINLMNDPNNGSFNFNLCLKLTDGAGESHENQTSVLFEGVQVEFGGSYQADAAANAAAALAMLSKLSNEYQEIFIEGIDPIGPISEVAQQRFVNIVKGLVASGTPEAEQVLIGLKAAYGASFYKLLFAQASRKATSRGVPVSTASRIAMCAAKSRDAANEIAKVLATTIVKQQVG